MTEDKRAEWAEAAQAELDKAYHAPKPGCLPKKPTAKDLILFAYDEQARLAHDELAKRSAKPEAPKPKLRSIK